MSRSSLEVVRMTTGIFFQGRSGLDDFQGLASAHPWHVEVEED